MAPVLILQLTQDNTHLQFNNNNQCVNSILNGETIKISVHGSGWFKNTLIKSSSDFSNLISQINPFDIPNSIGGNLKGSLCCYVSYKRSIYILPDVLGSAIVFKYQKDNITAFSSDLSSLVASLRLLGLKPKKNINYLVELISTGNGGLNSSSYENIEAIENFSYIKINNNKFTINKYSKHEQFFSTSSSDILFEEARCEILSNVESALESSLSPVAHLTGGFDSRLILSALSCFPDYKKKVTFFCSGNSELLDKKIALQIGSHLNLRMSDSDGTYYTNSQLPSFNASQGLVKLAPPNAARDNNLILSGGYGECLRSFYKSKYKLDKNYNITDMLKALYGDVCFGNDKNTRFTSENFYQDYAKKLDKFIKDSLDKGLRYDAILDYMYLAVRNRYYVGLTSLYNSNISPRIDPLYALSGFKLALNTELEKRQNNFIGLNLMRSFNENILGLPFDYDRIGTEYEKAYGKVEKVSPIKGNIEFVSFQRENHPRSSNVAYSKNDIEKAKKLSAPLWQVAHLKNAQCELASNLENIGVNKISEAMNYKTIEKLATSELNNRISIRYVHSINEALKWYFE